MLDRSLSLFDLPVDKFTEIQLYLSIQDIERLEKSSKEYFNKTDLDCLWLNIIKRDFKFYIDRVVIKNILNDHALKSYKEKYKKILHTLIKSQLNEYKIIECDLKSFFNITTKSFIYFTKQESIGTVVDKFFKNEELLNEVNLKSLIHYIEQDKCFRKTGVLFLSGKISRITKEMEDEFLLISIKIKELNLSSCGLANFPPIIFELGTLRKLDISGNNISYIPPDIKHLKLEKFIARNNNINQLPDEFFEQPMLECLDLSNSSNYFSKPDEFGKINRNQFDRIPSGIANLKNLKDIWFDGVGLKSLQNFPILPNLNRLRVGENELTEIPSEIFNLPSLRDNGIDVVGNPIANDLLWLRFNGKFNSRIGMKQYPEHLLWCASDSLEEAYHWAKEHPKEVLPFFLQKIRNVPQCISQNPKIITGIALTFYYLGFIRCKINGNQDACVKHAFEQFF